MNQLKKYLGLMVICISQSIYSQNYLGKRKEFDTDKDLIIEYCKYAVKFFENV